MEAVETQQQSQQTAQAQNLTNLVYNLVAGYLKSNKSMREGNLYDMVLSEIEPPLLKALMEYTRYNQSKAASILGLSRGTTRKKLAQYFGEKYFPQLSDDDSDN